MKGTTITKDITEAIRNSIQLMSDISQTMNDRNVYDDVTLNLVEYVSNHQTFGQITASNLVKTSIIDKLIKTNMVIEKPFKERLKAATKDSYYNLYKLYSKDMYKHPKNDFKQQDVLPYLHDHFFMKGKEELVVLLEDLGNGWKLGPFLLGENTLKGV